MSAPASADTITLYAAGSLKAALTDVASAYEAKTGHKVVGNYGPLGLLKNELAAGAKPTSSLQPIWSIRRRSPWLLRWSPFAPQHDRFRQG